MVLWPQLEIPVFNSVGELQSRIGFLWFLARSTEVWAVSSGAGRKAVVNRVVIRMVRQ